MTAGGYYACDLDDREGARWGREDSAGLCWRHRTEPGPRQWHLTTDPWVFFSSRVHSEPKMRNSGLVSAPRRNSDETPWRHPPRRPLPVHGLCAPALAAPPPSPHPRMIDLRFVRAVSPDDSAVAPSAPSSL